MIDFLTITVSVITPLTIGGAIAGVQMAGEYKEFKKNVENTFGGIKEELRVHEQHDQERHQQLLDANTATRKEIVDILLKK